MPATATTPLPWMLVPPGLPLPRTTLVAARAVPGVGGVHAGEASAQIDVGDGGAVEVVEGAVWITQADGGGMRVVVGHGGCLRLGARFTACGAAMGTTLTWRRARAMTGLGVSILTSGGLGISGGFTTTILGSCISILGDIGKAAWAAEETILGLMGSSFLEHGWKVSSVSRMRLSEIALLARGADDDEDEQSDRIDDQRDEDRRLALAAGIENAKMGKLHALWAGRVCRS